MTVFGPRHPRYFPLPSFAVKAPRPKAPRDLWEDFVHENDTDKKPSVWDAYPRPLPRTSVVSFEEEAAEDAAHGFEVVGEFFYQNTRCSGSENCSYRPSSYPYRRQAPCPSVENG